MHTASWRSLLTTTRTTAVSRRGVLNDAMILGLLLLNTACHSQPAEETSSQLTGPAVSTPAAADSNPVPLPNATTTEIRELDWLELMPADELEALQSSPAISHDGSFKPLQEGSFRTIPEMDGQRAKLPGYIVPVESDTDGKLTEFFLVPYFGACIHVPPPPPNQIIHGRLSVPVEMTDIYAAYWIEGTLHTETFENETAATAYTMSVERVYLWE